jgi:dihydroorotate dehydrogenase
LSPTTPWIYRAVRPLLFSVDAELAHRLTLELLRLAGGLPLRRPRFDPRLEQRLLGLRFGSPIGLAAGMDKDAEAHKSFIFMGLGFIEVGTVTPKAQPGNAKPRVLRHPGSRSLQNWLGFNSSGLEAVRGRLAHDYPLPVPVGVNIGRNRSTPDDAAESDYAELVEGLEGCCDFFVVNVSSPNTPGLRDMQRTSRLRDLVALLSGMTGRPLLVKLAPDLPSGEGARLGSAALEGGAAGLVLCNTTVDYSLVEGAAPVGGLSGRVLAPRSREMLAEVAAEVTPETVLVSVGGIDSGDEAYVRLRAGASLVEVFTALVFEGPGLPRRMARRLAELMDRDGVKRLGDVVGVDRPR